MSLTTIAALAGRRIDDPDSDTVHFPLDHVSDVRSALLEAFRNHKVSRLVCSAACGADLLALDAARQLGISRHLVLPFNVDAFRASSVVDRPGDWGTLYDGLITEARKTGDLLVMDGRPKDEKAYSQTTQEIIRQATLDKRAHLAIVVWDGKSRGKGDATEEFRVLAEIAKFKELTIPTC